MGWDDTLATGNPTVDEQHKTLLSIFDEIAEATTTGVGNREIGHMLVRLSDYVSLHFAEEEALMASHEYPELASHCAEHVKLSEKTRNLVLAHRLGVESAIPLTMLLREWVFEHIRGVDQRFAQYVQESAAAS